MTAFHQGLNEGGFVEGQNVAIDYRWAEGSERLPELSADLVRREVSLIVAFGDRRARGESRDRDDPDRFPLAIDPVRADWSQASTGPAATSPA